jgi:uncharacterized protein
LIGGGALGLIAGRSVASATENAVTLKTPTGDIVGTLTLPAGKLISCSRACVIYAPLVLIIAGSGPTDRDGNSKVGIRTDTYKLLAQGLAARGIGSLRYDKRGIGESVIPGLNEADLRFDMYVDDAVRWLEMLRTIPTRPSTTVQPGVPLFQKYFIAGHSEGSLIGMIAGARANVAGYVSLCGAGQPAYALIHNQLAEQLPPDTLAQVDAIMAKLRNGEQVANIPAAPGLAALFNTSVQPYLISWFKHDPATEIKKLKCPIAIVEGTADVQVSVSEAKLLSAAAPAAKLTIVDGMSHTLKHVDPAAGVTQQRTYTDSALALDPAVVDAIVSLVQRAR